MTIETQQVRIIYDGDGQSLSFAAPFPFMEKRHLRVFRGTGELGSTDEMLEWDIDYSVSGQAWTSGKRRFASAHARPGTAVESASGSA